jgi:hypothetical protein
MGWALAILSAGARSAATELVKTAAIAGVSYAGYRYVKYRQSAGSRAMGQEQQKVLEMVASGRITPEEGVRLLNALTASSQPRKKPLVDLPEIKVPKIDLTPLGEIAVELKNTVVSGAGIARTKLRDTKAGAYIDPKKYELAGPPVEGIGQAELTLEISAGKLKLEAGDTGGQLIVGKSIRVPDAPQVESSVEAGAARWKLNHSLGRASLKAHNSPEYSLKLQNAAADTVLKLDELKVNRLDIENNAGSIEASLGASQWLLHVNVQNNAGSVRLSVPPTHALRIVNTASMSSSNIEALGLKPVAGALQSADWDSSDKRCEVILVQNVASFELLWRKQKGEGLMEVVETPTETGGDNGIPAGEL